MKKRVLIFYVSKFSGHYHAASAIEKGLLGLTKDAETEMVNALDYTNPVLGKIINRTYLELIKKRPEIWGRIYDNPKVVKRTRKAREALHKYNMSKIKRLVDKKTPDVIYCTQALPCGMVADYKRSCGSKRRLIGVLTDHAPHSFWLFEEVDYYVVPSEETAQALEKKGVPRAKIRALGIPVDPKFRERHDKAELKSRLGLDEERPTVLIMGGSQGLGAMERIARSFLADTRHGYQIIIVTGSNKKLFSRLKRLNRGKGADRMKVLSFVDNTDELMEISDVIVSKPGGMTTAEALIKGLPMLIVDPIPGHERRNADFLVANGAAVEIGDLSRVYDKVNELFDSRDTLQAMRESARKLSKPDSALDVAKLALEEGA